MMNYIDRFFWLTEQAYDFSLLTRPIPWVLLLLVALASILDFPFKPSSFRKSYLIVFAPLLFSLVMVALGAVFTSNAIPGTAPSTAAGLIWLLFVLHLLAIILILRKLRSFRCFTSSVLLFEGYVAIVCSIISSMSISNDWF